MGRLIVGENNNLASISLLIFFCFVYFAFPKSFTFQIAGDFRLVHSYLGLWFTQRFILLFASLLFLFYILVREPIKVNRLHLLLLFYGLIFSIIQLLNEQYVVFYALVGVTVSYVLVNSIKYEQLSLMSIRLVIIFCVLYVLQFFYYRIGERITSSFLDPNISGYYLFLCYVIFRTGRLQLFSVVSLLIGLFTLSRNFYLAVLIFEVLRIGGVENFFKNKIKFTSPIMISIVSFLLVIIVSLYIVEREDYTVTIGDSRERIFNVNDGSNFARAKANTVMLERLAGGDFILYGNGSGVDNLTEHRPHNAFLRAIYRYGLCLSFFVFAGFWYVSRFFLERNYSIYLSLYAYYALLNDFISGADLILFCVVNIICCRLKEVSIKKKVVFR